MAFILSFSTVLLLAPKISSAEPCEISLIGKKSPIAQEFTNLENAPGLFPEPRKLKFHEIHHQRFGDFYSGKVPLVLIHGANTSSATFLSLAKNLGRSRPVVIYDLRGHGQTKDPGPGYYLEALADDLLTLLDGLTLEKAVLHGHSVGAAIALMFALRYPKRTQALSLEDMSGLPYKARTEKNLRETAFTATFLRSLKPSYVNESDLLRDAAELLRQRPSRFAESLLLKCKAESLDLWVPKKGAAIEELMLDVATRDLSAAYRAYPGPILLMKAEKGSRYLTEENVEKILDLRPDLFLDRIAGAGHSIHDEQPESWIRSLEKFLASQSLYRFK